MALTSWPSASHLGGITVLAWGVFALLAPGQGSQTPGMLAPWLELDGAPELLERFSERAGVDLAALGTHGSAQEVTDTAVAQPLIVALSLLSFRELHARLELPAETTVAGHSVGELAAAAMAGALTPEDAVAMAGVRGRAMAAACQAAPSSMAAVLGGDETTVLEQLERRGLTPANRNGGGQIVAAGAQEAIDALVAEPPEGARVRPLAVAGAFHTDFMRSAQQQLQRTADELPQPGAPRLRLLSNADGAEVSEGADVLQRLVQQVTLPVRWDACMAGMGELGTEAAVELAPGGTLTGLLKRGMRGTPAVAVKSPEDLESAVELLTAHGAETKVRA